MRLEGPSRRIVCEPLVVAARAAPEEQQPDPEPRPIAPVAESKPAGS